MNSREVTIPTSLRKIDIMSFILSTVPDPPSLGSRPTPGTTYIDISGTVSSDSVMTGYYVMWYRDTSVGCSHLNNKTLRMDEETIVKRVTNLEEGNRYTIAVKSFNLAGVSRGSSNNITIMTQESGEKYTRLFFSSLTCTLQLPPVHLLQ